MYVLKDYQDTTCTILDSTTGNEQTGLVSSIPNIPILGIFRDVTGVPIEFHTIKDDELSQGLIPYINLIQTPEIKEFAMWFRRLIPEYFFKVAASSTGKYHPPCNLGEGGVLRHTQFVCEQFKNLTAIESTGLLFQFTQVELDAMLVACIFHDFLKEGWNGNIGDYKKHAANAAAAFRASQGFIDSAVLELIAHCIETHMGQWCQPALSDKYQWLVHLSDYLASRNNISMISANKVYALSTQEVVYTDRERDNTVLPPKNNQSGNASGNASSSTFGKPTTISKKELTSAEQTALNTFLEKQMVLNQVAIDRYKISRPIEDVRSIIDSILKYNCYSEKQARYMYAAIMTVGGQ